MYRKRVFIFGLACLLFAATQTTAWAQHRGGAGTAPPAAQAPAPPAHAGHHMHGGGFVGGAGTVAVQPGFVPPGVLFPNALGNNVQLQAFPPIATPGIGNINQPGLPPGTPPMMPNVNNPAGPMFGEQVGRPGFGQFHRPGFTGGGRHRGGGFGNTVFVPYPYYVPYAAPSYYYYEAPPAPAAPPTPAEPPQPIQPSGPLYYTPPAVTGQGEQPSAPAAPSQTTPSTPGKQVTLLAFKDHTLVAVTEYWLKGDTLYYLRNGIETGIPLDQLDLPLTQQLNFERHVPFVLEARQ